MRADPVIITGTGLIALAALPPASPLLEARLPTHILSQYPVVIAGGAVIGARLARDRPAPWTAAPALLAVILTLAFWLLPRWIDASLTDPATRVAKIASLACLAGLPLGWGWVQAGMVLRGFLIANAAAMLAVMGWLLLAVPSRLCSAYLLTDQRLAGQGLLIAAALLVIGSLGGAMIARDTGMRDRTSGHRTVN
ncbi:hypothetical protein [Sinisalibacter aestuarii]|uniref:Uncharacterized protein n=1 Tax=Sinisalibacter aestuarii TaxID=2949426 RepID=A0ABQ5LS61_9RHOB|nr:hypothetical protein [Sinisalibacter aestuarii]GKY87759.1 hypothetical protein STA1M1_16280 [Sinisalibacter aestuarii]